MPEPRIYSVPVRDAGGGKTDLSEFQDRLVLIVNVASRCGLTDQYRDLQELQVTYGNRGFSVLAFPCNQFNGQEPGTALEVQEFCSTTFGADFPVYDKVEVNGPDRHALFEHLTAARDDEGRSGDVEWNFEKFLVAPGGEVVKRLRPRVRPTVPEFVSAIERHLPIPLSERA